MSRYDPLLDHRNILGQHFYNRLAGSDYALLWWDAKTPITRHTLAHVYSIASPVAPHRLAAKMRELKIKYVKDVLAHFTRTDVLECRGMGESVAYVLFAIGAHHNQDTHKWYGSNVTIATLKQQIHKREQEKGPSTSKEKRQAALAAAGGKVLRTPHNGKQRLAAAS